MTVWFFIVMSFGLGTAVIHPLQFGPFPMQEDWEYMRTIIHKRLVQKAGGAESFPCWKVEWRSQ